MERNGTVGYCMCKDMANFSNDQVTFHSESDVVHALCALFEHSLSAAMKFQWVLHTVCTLINLQASRNFFASQSIF